MSLHFRRFCAGLAGALVLGATFPAHALPAADSVPGGIALVKLGRIADSPEPSTPPRAWRGEQPVWVAAHGSEWFAVLGLALDESVGEHELRVRQAAGDDYSVRFAVAAKNYPAQHIRLKDSSKVILAPADEARALREIAEIRQLRRHWRDSGTTLDGETRFQLPADGRLGSRFGLRRFFDGKARAPHSGLDIAVPRGAPVKATAYGTVLATRDYFFNGKTVFVDHGKGLISLYCHLDRIDVQTGETLRPGQTLGLAGRTGRASSPHLHWSMVLNGVMVDPELFLDAH